MDRERGIGKALRAWPLLSAAGAILSVLLALLGGLGPTATRLAPRDADEMAYARRLVETGRFEDAEARLRALLEARPHVAAAHALLAESFIAAVRAGAVPSRPLLDRAWRALSAARALGQDVAAARKEVAGLLLERGWARDAVNRFRELVPASTLGLAEALGALARVEPAGRKALLDEAVAASRAADAASLAVVRARFSWGDRRFEEAISALSDADALVSAQVRFEHARVTFRLGRDLEADTTLEEAADQLEEPLRFRARLIQALIAARAGRARAVEEYVKKNPSSEPIVRLEIARKRKDLAMMLGGLRGVGRAHELDEIGYDVDGFEKGLLEAAGAERDVAALAPYAEVLGELRRLFPERSRYARDRARLLARLGRHYEAAEAFAAAAEMPDVEPDSRRQALRDAAVSYASGGHHALAAGAWGRMDDDEALFHRAVELRLAGSWTAALAALDDYVARARAGGYRVPEALKQRGEILEGLGRIEEALVAYEKVLGDPSIGPGAPEWAEALFRRGRLLLARGDCRSGDDGREALEDFLERYAAQPRPALETFEAGALLVRAAVAARRPDDARELLERIEAAAARLSPGERAGQEEHLARARRLAERKGGP